MWGWGGWEKTALFDRSRNNVPFFDSVTTKHTTSAAYKDARLSLLHSPSQNKCTQLWASVQNSTNVSSAVDPAASPASREVAEAA